MTTCEVTFEFTDISDSPVEGVIVTGTYTGLYSQTANDQIFVPSPITDTSDEDGLASLTFIRQSSARVNIKIPDTKGGYLEYNYMIAVPNAASATFTSLVTLNSQT